MKDVSGDALAVRKTKVLVMVPNGASTDMRVVREAGSLHAAGYDVLLSGIRFGKTMSAQAITDQGLPVRRIDWQYAAYSRLALIFLAIAVPMALVIGGLLIWAAIALYRSVFLALGDWFVAISFAQFAAVPPPPILAHLFAIVLLGGALVVFARIKRRLPRVARVTKSIPFASAFQRSLTQSKRFMSQASTRGAKTLADQVIQFGEESLGSLPERLGRKIIGESRTRGFVDLGREFQPDIVHCHEIGTLEAGVRLKRELGCKLIYEAHEIYDDLANASPSLSAEHRRIHAACLPQVDGFVTVNELIGDYYAERYPGLATPTIVQNSVWPRDRVDYDGRLHEAANLPPEARILLYQGGFSKNRGLEVLLEAAFLLPEPWYVVFMGWGAHEKQLLGEHGKHLNAALNSARNGFLTDAMRGTDGADTPLRPGATEVKPAVLNRYLSEEAQDAAATVANEAALQFALKGAANRARFIPGAPHSELAEWSAGATLGVIPYLNVGLNHWNCSPNKLWEYPNAGVPLLATRLAYLTQMIEAHDIGWTIPTDPTPRDIVSLVTSITDAELSRNRTACKSFIAKSNYTIHEKALLDLFERNAPAEVLSR